MTENPGRASTPADDAGAVVTSTGIEEQAMLGGVTPGTAVGHERVASLRADAWRELRRNPIFLVSSVLIVVFVVMAAFPGLLATRDPNAPGACDLAFSLQRPSAAHWFGYDLQGCDIYTRVIHGARASILVGILCTLLVTLVGGFVGVVAGFYGGLLDTLLSRLAEIFFGLPLVLGGIVFLTVFTFEGVWGVVLALTVLYWPQTARIMRSAVISTKSADYVQAARALGAGGGRIIVRHVLPNALAPVIVVATINLGVFITAEATLSFLGIGLQPPTISWGIMISDAQQRVLQAPHVLLFPALFLSLAVLSFILLGDAVRDALDPKLR
jgi:oligopeptide transport system permease protein